MAGGAVGLAPAAVGLAFELLTTGVRLLAGVARAIVTGR